MPSIRQEIMEVGDVALRTALLSELEELLRFAARVERRASNLNRSVGRYQAERAFIDLRIAAGALHGEEWPLPIPCSGHKGIGVGV